MVSPLPTPEQILTTAKRLFQDPTPAELLEHMFQERLQNPKPGRVIPLPPGVTPQDLALLEPPNPPILASRVRFRPLLPRPRAMPPSVIRQPR